MLLLQYKWTVLTVTTVGVLMAGIDSRIVIVGLPQVASALRADAEQAIWFTQAYVLGTTVALLLIGRVTDIVGRVKIYISGFTIFTLGSALTSLAWGSPEFILFRGIQGLGAAILFTNSIAMIVDATPKNELGFALGVNQIAFRFGAMAGLTVSGIILSFLDWRALFYINVPIGIFGTVWAQRRLKEIASLEKGTPIDWVGFVTFTFSLTSFILALTYAAYGIAEQITVYEFLIVSAISMVAFVAYERNHEHPLLDLRLLKIREFTGGIIAQLLNTIAWGAVLLLLSLYFQLVLGLSPFDAGIRIIPFDIAFLFLGVLSGRFSDRFGHLPFTTSGLALTSISLYLFSTSDASTPYSLLAIYMVLLGAGIGLFISPNISSIMGSVPTQRRGIASAFRATFFNVGFTISLNLAVLIMTFTVPYAVVTKIISSTNPIVIPEVDKILFSEGLKNTYLWLAVLNTAAIPPSVLRGSTLSN
ncbi:MAG: MFS transporter [archaeon]|nr:MFS transporter [archaeon]MCP8316066.1 MFS transporter [archaeon]MCP8320904.1 MFS transporter [archaeon]